MSLPLTAILRDPPKQNGSLRNSKRVTGHESVVYYLHGREIQRKAGGKLRQGRTLK